MYARGVASLDGATPRYRGRPEGQDPKGTPGKPTETSKAVRSGGLRRWGGGVLRYALAGSLADDANLRRVRPPQRARQGVAPRPDAARGEDHEIEKLLGDPSHERRIAALDENLERCAVSDGSEQLARLPQLVVGLLAHRAVVLG